MYIASQYKSKMPFADVSFGVEDHGLTIERHFFGSRRNGRHGKGPSDGEGGVVKSGATRAIKNEQMMITDAASFQMFGEELMRKEQHVSDKCVHSGIIVVTLSLCLWPASINCY